MEYLRLGNTGLKVSRVCLGCMSFGSAAEWMVEVEASRRIIDRAWDLGINFFDTANVYSKGRSEEILGEALVERRSDAVIATKARGEMGEGPNDRGLSRYHVMKQITGSLRRLRTDHVDLYQIHRWDYETPIQETLTTLNDLVRKGEVRYIGASSMHAWQLTKALWTSERLGIERFVSMQNHYNLCYREEEREMIPLCQSEGIGLIPWSPLARGFLTGKYRRDGTPDTARYRSDRMMADRYFHSEDFDVLERVIEVAREKDVTPAQIALAWIFKKGVTSPIIGATKVEHVEDAVNALSVQLSADDVKRLEETYRPHPIIGHT